MCKLSGGHCRGVTILICWGYPEGYKLLYKGGWFFLQLQKG
jgi:hypothetical protein